MKWEFVTTVEQSGPITFGKILIDHWQLEPFIGKEVKVTIELVEPPTDTRQGE